MNNLSRRRFFQLTGGALGAIGLNQLALTHRANTYGRALAQSTQRKVALLVGINDYSRNRLGGALNDVELQKQLLIHRFGFHPDDVHILKEAQATRQNILGAFNEYLYEPASPGDVMVFHFSGHGDRVTTSKFMPEFTRLPGNNCLGIENNETCLNTAIAPYRYDSEGPGTVQDIMGHTLLLLRAALAQKTENVTFILDCCYAGGGKRGNAVMRSLHQPELFLANNQPATIIPEISGIEWETQQAWLERINWNLEDFANAIRSPIGQGFFVGSAKSYQLAADYSFDGFIAGAFTYLLTQYLWQATSPLSETVLHIANSSQRLRDHNQTPEFDPKPSGSRAVRTTTRPVYHVEPISPPAEALILGPTGEEGRVWLWLGGLDPQQLEAFDQGTVFAIIDKVTGEPIGEVQQVEGTRRELVAEGQLINSANKSGENKGSANKSTDKNVNLPNADLTGQPLQESTRGIPETVTLKIGLDDTLTPTEQQSALDIFSRSPDFEACVVQPGKLAHVLIGRYSETVDQLLADQSLQGSDADNPAETSSEQAVGSIGLFSPTQRPILANSFGPVGERIEDAIARLRSRFISLHIGRMLALMGNGQASQLNVSVSVDHLGSRSGTTTRGGDPEDIIIPRQAAQGIEQVPIGNEILVRVHNHEPVDLHFGLLAIDAAGEVIVLFPPVSDDPKIDLIPSGGSRVESQTAIEPEGIAELLVLASPSSLIGPLRTLRSKAPRLRDPNRRGTATSAAEVMTDIFGAMDTRSGNATEPIEGPRLLDVKEVAVLSLLFEIVS